MRAGIAMTGLRGNEENMTSRKPFSAIALMTTMMSMSNRGIKRCDCTTNLGCVGRARICHGRGRAHCRSGGSKPLPPVRGPRWSLPLPFSNLDSHRGCLVNLRKEQGPGQAARGELGGESATAKPRPGQAEPASRGHCAQISTLARGPVEKQACRYGFAVASLPPSPFAEQHPFIPSPPSGCCGILAGRGVHWIHPDGAA